MIFRKLFLLDKWHKVFFSPFPVGSSTGVSSDTSPPLKSEESSPENRVSPPDVDMVSTSSRHSHHHHGHHHQRHSRQRIDSAAAAGGAGTPVSTNVGGGGSRRGGGGGGQRGGGGGGSKSLQNGQSTESLDSLSDESGGHRHHHHHSHPHHLHHHHHHHHHAGSGRDRAVSRKVKTPFDLNLRCFYD